MLQVFYLQFFILQLFSFILYICDKRCQVHWIFIKIQARVFFFNCIGFCLAMRIAIGIVNKHNKFDVFVCVCTLSMTL